MAIFFIGGGDAVLRLAAGDTEGIGLSLPGAAVQTLVSGLLLVLVVDALRRGYVVFRPGDLDLHYRAIQPGVVHATGRFDSFGRVVNRHYEAAALRVEPTRLLLVSPPGAEIMAQPASGSGGSAVMSTPADPGEDHFWIELSAWRITEVASGHLYFGFSRDAAVRFTQVRAGRRRMTYVAASTESQARWLFEWVDSARASSSPT